MSYARFRPIDRGELFLNDLAKRFANLSPEKRKLLEMQLSAKGIDYTHYLNSMVHNLYSNIEPVAVNEHYPVSSAQMRMYVVCRMEENNIHYNVPGAVLIEGAIRREQLEKAFRTLINRHEMLRTSFEMAGGQLVQRVHHEVDFEVSYQELPEERTKEAIDEFIRPFDLRTAPLLRVRLIRFAEERHLLLYDMHHIITDGISMIILIQEFIDLYHGMDLPELRIQYKDFAAWQNRLFQDGLIKKQEDYWLQNLSGELPVLNLGTDYPRPVVQSFEGNWIKVEIGPELTKGINRLATQTGATVYMILLAVYNLLLSKYTGQEDIIIGSPIAGRLNADLEKIIGLFINTLVMRNYPAGAKTFREFLEEVKQNSLDAYKNQEYPFDELIHKMNLKNDLARNPLFDIMFVLQNRVWRTDEIYGLKFAKYPFENKTAKFDLLIEAVDFGDRIQLKLEYKTKLFRRETMEKFLNRFLIIIEQVLGDMEIPLKDILIVDEHEKRLLFEFNNTQALIPNHLTIARLFEEQANRTPDHIAVLLKDRQLSYDRLNAVANQLAWLLRRKGVGPNQIVAIMAERSLEMIIGILGVLKAGGAYLPIDRGYPDERINYLLNDSGANLLLVQGPLKPGVKFGPEIIVLDTNGFSQEETTDLANINSPNDLAYVIYTSGTTGKPKGVLVEQHSISNNIQWRKGEYGFSENDVVLQLFSYVFDGFLTSFFTPLISGAKVVLLTDEDAANPITIKNWIVAQKVTHFISVPTLYHTILNVLTPEDAKCLRSVTLAGERTTDLLIEQSKGKNAALELVNEYGPTESTVVASVCRDMRPGEVISIGKPIANTQIYIMGKFNQLQPIGIPGELWIAGAGLARGYLNLPELTAEKFGSAPFINEQLTPNNCQINNNGQRIYKTGDLARWLPDGNIEFLERIDHQVKIRGFRIETSEIETRLLRHVAIKKAIVIAKDDLERGTYLCAYLVADRELTVQDVRGYLAQTLPEYMIPSYFLQLAQLPLTPSGKIDRKALPDCKESMNTGVEYIAPKTSFEIVISEIWKEILGLHKVGIHDNFFDLGGHSLLMTRVNSLVNERLKDILKEEISVVTMFQYPTIHSFSQYLLHKNEINPDNPIERENELNNTQKVMANAIAIAKRRTMD